MEQLVYSIADISLCIKAPYKLDISRESVPFIQTERWECDEQILISQAEFLPPMDRNGIWHQDRYYVSTDVHENTYFRLTAEEKPYAWIAYGQNGPIRISYLPGAVNLLRQSSHLINMLGLEQLLLRHGGLILHASLIRWQGQSILFSAPSGTGKSTQASLWETHMGAEILNGDRAGIRYVNGKWTAYGLPYAGSSHIFRNESAPIGAIVILRQGKENVIKQMTPVAALRALIPEFSAHRWNPGFMNKVLNIAAELLQEVPVYYLECLPDYGSVQLLRDTLRERESYDYNPG